MPTFTPDWTDVDYTPPSVTGHADQKMNIFLPEDAAPADGYPVLVDFPFAGWTVTARYTSFDGTNPVTLLHYWCLLNRIAVVSPSLTISDEAASYDGKGLFHPPGAASGHYESDTHPMAEKDAIHALQHLKENADTYGIDASKIFLRGSSAGAGVIEWLYGPDRKTTSTGTQTDQSTRPAASIIIYPRAWWDAWEQTDTVTPGTLNMATHFPDPEDSDAIAENLGAVDSDYKSGNSLVQLEDDNSLQDANSAIPTYMYSDVSPAITSFDDPTSDLDAEQDAHSAYGAFVLKQRHPRWRFAAPVGVANAVPYVAKGVDRVFHTTGNDLINEATLDQLAFVLEQAGYIDMGTFQVKLEHATPVMPVVGGGGETTGGTTSSTSWTQIVAADPDRRQGVRVRNETTTVAATHAFFVATTADSSGLPVGGPTIYPNGLDGYEQEVFMPGNNAVFVKSPLGNTVAWFATEV